MCNYDLTVVLICFCFYLSSFSLSFSLSFSSSFSLSFSLSFSSSLSFSLSLSFSFFMGISSPVLKAIVSPPESYAFTL